MTVGMLYSRWQQLRDQGQPVTPEDVCRDYPHFLEQLRELIRSGEVLFEIHGHSAAVESVATLPKDDPLDHSPATSSTLDASTSSISSSEMSEPGPTVSHHLPVQQRGETLVKPDIQGFEILSLLGMGGMGEVYKAKKIGFNITYALKIIRRDRVGLSAVERFRKEAEAMAKLEHPHIVRFFDVGVSETEDRPLYLTMRLLVGKTLAVRLGEWQNNLVKSVELMIKICSAVAYIHEQGMLHRDIKPGNVLFDEQDNPYVSDFGLVKETMLERPGQPRADESSLGPGIVAGQIREIPPTLPLTGIDTVLGTPPYMSPEQLAGNQSRLTPPSDVYALGVMLYELTVGHRPFRGSTVAEMRRLHATAEVALPSRHNVSFDSALEHILLKCLAWKPEDRYATAGELLRALEQWQRVQQDNRGPRIDRIPRKHRQGLSLALTVALLGIVSTAAFVLLSNNVSVHAEKTNIISDHYVVC